MSKFHLAQINIGRTLAPLDAPLMKEFTDFLAPVNKLGQDSPGFVWQLKEETGGASSYMKTPFDDDGYIVNMTVWENIESLRGFIFGTVHSYFLKNRSKWFEKATQIQVVLWWIPVGHIPTLEEAKVKIDLINKNGSSPEAFSFQKLFDENGKQILI